MVDRDYLEAIREGLDGLWEYSCRVTSKTPFENDEKGRGGRMLIMVSLPPTGLTVKIDAERLWAREDEQDTRENRTPLPNSLPWIADGTVVYTESKLRFEYFATDVSGAGVTKDTIHLIPKEGLYVGLGEFSHQREDGKVTSGVDQLRKMNEANDFEWAPHGINPGGTLVRLSDHLRRATNGSPVEQTEPQRGGIAVTFSGAGNVVVGDVSGELGGSPTQIHIGVKDTKALQTALEALRISPEDIDEIKSIVSDEQPRGKNLGSRAAAWVGSMFSKGLTGAWEVGKDVSADVLSAILLRYYGLK